MKLIIAIISKDDSPELLSSLGKSGFMSTKLATTGGFLRAGNVTLLIGTEDDRVEECLDVIRGCCAKHTQIIDPVAGGINGQFPFSAGVPVTVGGATVFVVDVERFLKM